MLRRILNEVVPKAIVGISVNYSVCTYPILINKAGEFVCLLEALISGTTGPVCSVLDRPFIEEDYRLCIITLRSRDANILLTNDNLLRIFLKLCSANKK